MRRLFQVPASDLGDGQVLFAWSPNGKYAAAASNKLRVCIYDRNGKLYEEIHLPPPDVQPSDPKLCSCTQLEWDASGDMLAVLQAGSSTLLVWAAATREVQKMETQFRAQELTAMAWSPPAPGAASKRSSAVAVATAKGNLQLFNMRDKRTTPLVGKHTKKAVAMAWSTGNVLAIASVDKTVSLSDGNNGETLRVMKFSGDPVQLAVADIKDPATGALQANQWSLITSKRALYLFDGNSDAAPKELNFIETYGQLQHHIWYEGSCIMLGFKTGRVIVISARSDTFGQELHSDKMLDTLSSMSHCPAAAQVAVGGGSTVKVVSVGAQYGEVASSRLEMAPGEAVQQAAWSTDGQVLTVSTTNGQVYCYLAALPVVYASQGMMLAQLVSLNEVNVMDVSTSHAVKITVACEPALCALGPTHLAVGMNHQVLFYSHVEPGRGLINKREYMGGISQVLLNASHAAVLLDGRLLVHPIAAIEGGAAEEHDASLPPAGVTDPIACAALSQHFAVTGSASGSLCYYLVEGLAAVNEYKHSNGILKVFPQPSGPRCVFEDSQHNTYLFSPVTDQLLALPGLEGSLSDVVWDAHDPHAFLVTNGVTMHLYKFLPVTVTGPRLLTVNKVTQPASHTPVAVQAGVVTCRLRSGALDVLNINNPGAVPSSDSSSGLTQSKLAFQQQFNAAIETMRLSEAWRAATGLRSPDAWRQLGMAALEVLDVETGMAAFRQSGDASMVMALAGLRWVTDRNLLSGHLLVLLERDYAHAQELFLRSSRPLAALEMRQDLKHWPQALALAQQLAPERVPQLSKEHAGLLELVGDYSAAQTHYQQALDALAASGGSSSSNTALQLACLSGLARTALHLGDLRTGRQLAQQVNTAALYKECGAILEGLAQLPEAADMYLAAGLVERAASIHIAAKNWAAVTPLMSQVASAKLQVQFAKAKEAEGRWGEAATAFEAAGDVDNAVRLLTDRLDALGRAAALVRKSRSKSAAAGLARHCLAAGDDRGAVEFLLIGGQLDQAFDIAAARGQMEAFAELVMAGTSGAVEATRIAEYYAKRGELEKAGDMWARAGQPGKAVSLYVQLGSPSSIGKAINVLESAAAASNPNLKDMEAQVTTAINSLQEEGAAADELRLRLNMATGQLQAAARDAVQVARYEQEEGNYKLAHAKLSSTVQQLVSLGVTPPQDLLRHLGLLHSYVLVKSLVAMNNHEAAARMLVRVAGSISKFPKHVVPILTSTVIECQRAGLKKSSLEHAMTLMRPEYRNQVPDKYRKKIELMVRKPDRGDDPPEPLLPCPFCQLPGPASELQCVSCQNIIPFDISTGMRMYASDWCECPQCHFSGTGQGLMAVLAAEGHCPMCNAAVAAAEVRQVLQPLQHWSCSRLDGAPAGSRSPGPAAAVEGAWG